MKKGSCDTPSKRLTLRAFELVEQRVEQIIEQDIPATEHQVGLFLRRDPFKSLAAHALLNGGVVKIEVKGER